MKIWPGEQPANKQKKPEPFMNWFGLWIGKIFISFLILQYWLVNQGDCNLLFWFWRFFALIFSTAIWTNFHKAINYTLSTAKRLTKNSISQFGLWFHFELQILIEEFKFIETRIPFLCFLLLGLPILIYLVFHFESIFPSSPVSFLFYK